MVEALPLTATDLRKSYKKRSGGAVEAVKGVSFQIERGECYGLLGPNGAGKSTTINCLIGFYPTTSGTVLLGGLDVYKEAKRARQSLGVCPQEDTLDTDFSVFDQMVRHATFFRIHRREAERRATDLLNRFQLLSNRDDSVSSLSGGMRRRLQVARALISGPTLLVLDEPTTGLDPEARRIVWEILLESKRQGMAILLTTHYMDEAERLCDRVGILHEGRVLDEATPGALISRYVPTPIVEEEIRPGVYWKRPANLEDVFLKLTGSPLVNSQRNG